jgi:hypothetical protein
MKAEASKRSQEFWLVREGPISGGQRAHSRTW